MRQAIEVGQHYIKLDGISTVWEVVARIRDPGGVPHVRLRNVNDPSMTKLISEPTLRNHRFYRILESRAERVS